MCSGVTPRRHPDVGDREVRGGALHYLLVPAAALVGRAHLAQANADYSIGIASAQAQLSAVGAAVRDAELTLGYCRMYAPLNGRIGEARVKVGNLVGPDPAGGGAFTDLASIQQLDP